MTARELEEYTALRATIRERGTARVWIFVAGLAAWAALVVTTATVSTLPLATLLPLLVLAATFEAIFGLHIGVERVGRYIQVFFEDDSERGWEHTAMAFGRTPGPVGTDPLFAKIFWLATFVNLLPALLYRPVPVEWIACGAPHVLLAIRILVAKRQAGQQRAIDLARFQQMKQSAP
jgi:hypothetical protein